jgi:hypothetical protein
LYAKDIDNFKSSSGILKNCENYQLHKLIKNVKVIKPIIRFKPNIYVQANTINLSEFFYFNYEYSYALTCVDIFSKKAWIFPFKHNSASKIALAFKTVIFNCLNLKTIHTDNGSEFMTEFDKLIKDNKLIHHFGCSYTSQGQK